MMYKNNKTNMIGTITRSSEETKRVTLTFEDGTEKEMALSTLKDKRYYTPITEEEYNKSIVKEVTKVVRNKGPKAKAKAVKKATQKKAKAPKEVKVPRIMVTYNGKTQSPKEWEKETGIKATAIRKALRSGKSPEEIFGKATTK